MYAIIDADELNGYSWYFFEPILGDLDDCIFSVLDILLLSSSFSSIAIVVLAKSLFDDESTI